MSAIPWRRWRAGFIFWMLGSDSLIANVSVVVTPFSCALVPFDGSHGCSVKNFAIVGGTHIDSDLFDMDDEATQEATLH